MELNISINWNYELENEDVLLDSSYSKSLPWSTFKFFLEGGRVAFSIHSTHTHICKWCEVQICPFPGFALSVTMEDCSSSSHTLAWRGKTLDLCPGRSSSLQPFQRMQGELLAQQKNIWIWKARDHWPRMAWMRLVIWASILFASKAETRMKDTCTIDIKKLSPQHSIVCCPAQLKRHGRNLHCRDVCPVAISLRQVHLTFRKLQLGPLQGTLAMK